MLAHTDTANVDLLENYSYFLLPEEGLNVTNKHPFAVGQCAGVCLQLLAPWRMTEKSTILTFVLTNTCFILIL